MIEGVVTEAGVPVVRLPVAGREWMATIDTGFNGGLELPEVIFAKLSPRFYSRSKTLLAGG